MQTSDKQLALFDFDGTITRKDSLFDFLLFCAGWRRFLFGLLMCLPAMLSLKLGWREAEAVKSQLLLFFFKRINQQELTRLGAEYCNQRLSDILRNDAIKAINYHQSLGHNVVVVTASIGIWIRPWCQQLGIELISTEMAFEKGLFTGCFATPNCNGEEKVRRIKQRLDLEDYKQIIAYGDTQGDIPMLALADKQYYRCFPDL